MALLQRSGGLRREWFTDDRDSGRQMELTWHRDEQIVIISLWQGAVCRATFRMPITEAPSAIGVLADALGDAATSTRVSPSNTSASTSMRSLVERLRQWLRGQRAEVVNIREWRLKE